MGNGTTLLEALLKGRQQYADNPLVASGVAMAQTMPSLHNPYASTGKNIGLAAGTGLLAALVGNLGRSDTDSENLRLYRDANKLMNTTDTGVRANLIENNPRLVDFASALDSQQQELLMDEAVKAREEQRKLVNEMQLQAAKSYSEMYPSEFAEAFGLVPQAPTGSPSDVNTQASGEVPAEKLAKVDLMQQPEVQGQSVTLINQLMNQGYTEKEARVIAMDQVKKANELELQRKQKLIGGGELPATMIADVAKSKSIINESLAIADDLEKSGMSWSDLRKAKNFSGLDETGIALRINNLIDRLSRARSGAALTPYETKIFDQIVSGDLSASPAQVSKLLRKFANAEANIMASQIDVVKQQNMGGIDAIASDLSEVQKGIKLQEIPEPPAGYELTGKRDANGNWGIRRIK